MILHNPSSLAEVSAHLKQQSSLLGFMKSLARKALHLLVGVWWSMLWLQGCRMPGSKVCGISTAQANNCVVLGEFTEVPLEFLQRLWMSSAVPLEASSWGPGQVAGVSGLVMGYV